MSILRISIRWEGIYSRGMKTRTKVLLGTTLGVLASASMILLVGGAATRHPVTSSPLGIARSSNDLERVVDQPGPVTVETVVAADWAVDRDGLLDLKSPEAQRAGLRPGSEPIRIYLHALRHPTRGLYLVDTGVEQKLGRDPAASAIGSFAARAMHAENIKVRVDTASWLQQQAQPVAGVLLTHLHIDHVMGIPDLPAATPLYVGPGETRQRSAMQLITAPILNRELAGKQPLYEWRYQPDADRRFAGVLDVFGDGTVWAIWVPGHTAGSTAYLVRTPSGPVLLTGDASHTRWGWDHGVPPGSFSADRRQGAESLHRLVALVARHPSMVVRLGHQD
jgi:N-acyl homoserine lactone hydrolase